MSRRLAVAASVAALLLATPGCITSASYDVFMRERDVTDEEPGVVRGQVVNVTRLSIAVEGSAVAVYVGVDCDDGVARTYVARSGEEMRPPSVGWTGPPNEFQLYRLDRVPIGRDGTIGRYAKDPGRLGDRDALVNWAGDATGVWSISVWLPRVLLPRETFEFSFQSPRSTEKLVHHRRDPPVTAVLFLLLFPFTLALDVAFLPIEIPYALHEAFENIGRMPH